MEKTRVVPLVQCINPYIRKYNVHWDIKEHPSVAREGMEPHGEDGKERVEYDYKTHTFGHLPTLEEVKEVIVASMNADIDNEIKTGYVWDGKQVWLSGENQFNYKAAYDMAVQTKGATLPVTFKLGTEEAPQYHTFESVAELGDFYKGALEHISDCLTRGWERKDGYDWSGYDAALAAERKEV